MGRLDLTVRLSRTTPHLPVCRVVSLRAGSSYSITITVSIFCHNYRRCFSLRIKYSGVSLTFGDTFQ